VSWWDDAACIGDTALFFPERGVRTAQANAIRAKCAACPVLVECRQDALERPAYLDGWQAGMSPREIDAARNGRVVAHREREDAARCGTESGYKAHRRRGEDACRRCLDALAANARERSGRKAAERKVAS
jgi:hypothetical protein